MKLKRKNQKKIESNTIKRKIINATVTPWPLRLLVTTYKECRLAPQTNTKVLPAHFGLTRVRPGNFPGGHPS